MKKMYVSVMLFAVVISSCKSKPDISKEKEKEKNEILNLLAQERDAHFNKDTELFMSGFADSMISVNRGIVQVATSEENKERIDRYFGKVKFISWDDMAEPVIRFSDDGSMAYALVQKEVIVTFPDITSNMVFDTTYYAWASIYRKQKGGWKIETNISTNK